MKVFIIIIIYFIFFVTRSEKASSSKLEMQVHYFSSQPTFLASLKFHLHKNMQYAHSHKRFKQVPRVSAHWI